MELFSSGSGTPQAATLVLVAAFALSGCSTLNSLNPFGKSSGAKESDSAANAKSADRNSPFVSQGKSGYVRLEPLEGGAAPNDHPIGFTATQIRAVLAGFKTARDGDALFSDDELTEIAAPIAAALGKAGPGEDVAFAVAGKHGGLSALTLPAVTSGRVFHKGGALNFIFGEVRSQASDQLTSTGFLGAFVLRDFPAGSRNRPSANGAVASGGSAAYAGGRRDWLLVAATGVPPPLSPVRSAPAATTPGVAPAAAATEQDIERRLTTLKGLRDKGLITEEEYNDKRKEILKNL